MLNELLEVLLSQMRQFELGGIDLLYAFCFQNVIAQVGHQLDQLVVLLVAIEGQNRDSICQLEAE